MCILTPFRAKINTQIQEKYLTVLLFSELFYVFSFICLLIRHHNEMIFTFCICKHVEEVVSYKFVYFGAICCKNKYTKWRKHQNVLLFSEQFYVFLFTSLLIPRHIEMIFKFRICKHVEEVVSYKYVYFGAISCKNKYTKSRKTSERFAVFRAVLCFFVYFYINTTS